MTALTFVLTAIDFGNGEALDLLRSRGVQLTLQDDEIISEFNLLEFSCRRGQPDSVRALLRDETIVQSVLDRQSDALREAAFHGRASTLEVLFERFSFEHVKSEEETEIGGAVLLNAAVSEDLATVQIVLDQPGVEVDEYVPGHMTALQYAASRLDFKMAAALLARGADTSGANLPGSMDVAKLARRRNRNAPENMVSGFLRLLETRTLD